MKNSCKLCELISNIKYRDEKEKKRQKKQKQKKKQVHAGKGSVEPFPTILAIVCVEEKSASVNQ